MRRVASQEDAAAYPEARARGLEFGDSCSVSRHPPSASTVPRCDPQRAAATAPAEENGAHRLHQSPLSNPTRAQGHRIGRQELGGSTKGTKDPIQDSHHEAQTASPTHERISGRLLASLSSKELHQALENHVPGPLSAGWRMLLQRLNQLRSRTVGPRSPRCT